jgi:hypothetical protein
VEGNPHGRRYERAHLAFAGICTLATVAGLIVALVATDTIVISSPNDGDAGKAEAEPPLTVTEPVTRTESESSAPRVPADCTREPNDERIEATPVALGVCRAGIETLNDQDWYRFTSPQGGPVTARIEKAESGELGDVIAVTIFEDDAQIESELVASDEPFTFPYTLASGSEMIIEIQDGCSPACGPSGYVLKLE